MRTLMLVLLLAVGTRARAAVVAAPGFAVHEIATPGTVQGGVVRHGGALFVGQGAFGAGTEQIVRLDGSGATTIATGFNSLGGLDVDTAGTLYAVDNGGNLAGATTGDTVFAIPNALTATSAVAAAGHEVVPAGTIPFAADVLVLGDGSLLVSDATGFGAGRVLHVQAGPPATATPIITGLDFVGSVALDLDGTLLVGNVTFDASFNASGAILRYTVAGASLGTLVSGLSGAVADVVDGDGNVLVSGGFTSDFSSSTVVAVAPDATVTERAHGFSFSGELYFDTARDELLVNDFGVTHVTAICRDQDGDGVCDVDDDCPAAADPAQTDTDGDGAGDACDVCTNPTAVDDGKVALAKVALPHGDDTLAFAGSVLLPEATAAALDPVANGVRFVLADTSTTIADVTIPGGAFTKATKTGWKSAKGAFKYVNPAGIQGIVAAKVKPSSSVAGLVVLAVKGKKGTYLVDPARLPLRATMALAPGVCGEVAFDAPACTYVAAKGKVKCH